MWKLVRTCTALLLTAALFLTPAAVPVHAASASIQGVPVYGQYPELPSGCEATAVSMVMRWAGAQVTKVDVANATPRQPLPYWQDGVMKGGDPHKGFVGDPFVEKGSFGVFAKPMVAVVNKYLPGRGVDLSGKSFAELLQVIDSGRPVAAWVTNYLKEPTVNARWTTAEGRTITWRTPEHVMTIIGYNDTQIIVNDAADGQVRSYNRARFQYVWETMGRHALTVAPAVTYQVYQNHNLLKEFHSLADSIAYAKLWARSRVVDKATGQWKWDNVPSQVFQRDRHLKDFASQLEAVAYARQWDHAMVKDRDTGRIAWSNWPLTVFVNGEEQQYDQPPVNENGRVLVPLRGISERLGSEVEWDDVTRTVTVVRAERRIVIQIGSTVALVDGKEVQLDVPAKIINGRTMVPVRFFTESFGAQVGWEGMLQSVYITVADMEKADARES